jgi:hypothetical protein
LASIGKYCGVGTFSSGVSFPWSKQRRFIDQCDVLSCNATWWNILSNHRVSFDPNIFSQLNESRSVAVDQIIHGYCEKLIWNAIDKLGHRSTLSLARRFMKDYRLSKHVPPSIIIEYLLSVSDDNSRIVGYEVKAGESLMNNTAIDIRNNLNQIEIAVRESLSFLPILNQNLVLRKCVMNLEENHNVAKDYERLAMVLQLYRDCLNRLSGQMKKSDTRAKAHEEETGRIERRCDALVIISSIFERCDYEERPAFTKLFEPLPRDPSHPSMTTKKVSFIPDTDGDVFDPLAPLDGVIENTSIVAVLAPLCSLLQLPAGYLHSRSLVVRFSKMKASGVPLPPFDTSIIPIAKKLKASRDLADLAWWCSLQYEPGSVEQLKCLDMAHAHATVASEEAESCKDVEEEYIALERVKQIDAAKSGLADKILITEVLNSHKSTPDKVNVLFKSIVGKAHSKLDNEYRPEDLVYALLVEGSLASAEASLDEANGLATNHFRLLAMLVHDACKCLSRRYSHINVGKYARLLTRKLLVHGDDSDIGSMANIINVKEEEAELSTIVEEEENENTSEFVMDIGMISTGSQTWSNESSNNDKDKHSKITSTEEPSAISPSSQREMSDRLCSRVALRCAFMICFAEDYHSHIIKSSSPTTGEENIHCNILPTTQTLSVKRQRAATNNQKSNFIEGDLALQHARELLGIVFARQGSTIASTCGFLFDDENTITCDESILQTTGLDNSTVVEIIHPKKRKALSFAMRHRALRVATMLCPHEIIARVVMEEKYYTNDFGDAHMIKCAFVSFVAMEIEVMGLPLPYSDLLQLSAMHFCSYARTIWRNHGSSSSTRGFSGRLHLLLLELCINQQESIDWELVMILFSELERLELSRSLLLACECAVKSRAVVLAVMQKRDTVLQCIESAVWSMAKLIVREIESSLHAGIEIDTLECSSTLHRLTSVINAEGLYPNPIRFVERFISLSRHCTEQRQVAVGNVFMNSATRITQHLTDPVLFSNTATSIRIPSNEERNNVGKKQHSLNAAASQDHVCSLEIHRFESLFNYND